MKEANKIQIIKPKKFSNDELEKYISEQMDELRNDKDVYAEIKKLGVKQSQVRDYLAFFIDFKNDFNQCKGCKGCKDCHKENKYRNIYLTIDGERVERHIGVCHYAAEIRKSLSTNYPLFHDFDDDWVLTQFADLMFLKTRSQVLNACADLIERKNKNWIYLCGDNTSGKSYILVSLMNSLCQVKRGPAACINCAIQIKELQSLSIEDKETFNYQLNYLMNVPLLLLDNFGEGPKTEFVRDTIIQPILNERSRQGLLTFFTSSFTMDEIESLYANGKNYSASKIISGRLVKLIKNQAKKEIILADANVFKK